MSAPLAFGRDHVIAALAAAVAAARAAGADDAEASFDGGAYGFTRFAGSYFTQAGAVVEPVVRVRAAVGGRVGAALAGALDDETLAGVARRAVAFAREQSPPPRPFPGFARPDPSRTPVAGRFSEATAAAGPAERADACAKLFARAARAGLVCAGAMKSGPRELAVVTAGGVSAYHALTECALEVIVHDPDLAKDASAHAVFHGPDLAALDVDALADEPIEHAAFARTAVDVAPGAHSVVLAPTAVAEALEWMAMTAISARAVLDGGSFLSGAAPGAPLCAPAITLRDDGGYDHPSVVGVPFDAEGVTRLPVTAIDAGKAGAPVSDLATAAALGTASTGHASGIAGDFSEGPGPATLVLAPGDATVQELCARVGDGLYVTRFHYVNGYLDTRRATMTGMTRDGLFEIRGGKLGAAVRNLRWTDSFLAALGAERLLGVGKVLQSIPTTWTKLGQILTPALAVRGFKFTGKSR